MRFRKPPFPPSPETERVERAAARLSPLERKVLVLSAGQRMRNADIAVRLGISERRAERLLAKALRKFDRAMANRRPWWRFWSADRRNVPGPPHCSRRRGARGP